VRVLGGAAADVVLELEEGLKYLSGHVALPRPEFEWRGPFDPFEINV
jgi:hypothetical protein